MMRHYETYQLLFASLFILSAHQMKFHNFVFFFAYVSTSFVYVYSSSMILVPMADLQLRSYFSSLMLSINIYLAWGCNFILTCLHFGGFLFVLGINFGAYLLSIYLVIASPVLYDFYNYGTQDPKFTVLLKEFFQHVAFLGALLFFIGMKTSIQRRPLKKKHAPKQKAN